MGILKEQQKFINLGIFQGKTVDYRRRTCADIFGLQEDFYIKGNFQATIFKSQNLLEKFR